MAQKKIKMISSKLEPDDDERDARGEGEEDDDDVFVVRWANGGRASRSTTMGDGSKKA